jgi:hypothetical protein
MVFGQRRPFRLTQSLLSTLADTLLQLPPSTSIKYDVSGIRDEYTTSAYYHSSSHGPASPSYHGSLPSPAPQHSRNLKFAAGGTFGVQSSGVPHVRQSNRDAVRQQPRRNPWARDRSLALVPDNHRKHARPRISQFQAWPARAAAAMLDCGDERQQGSAGTDSWSTVTLGLGRPTRRRPTLPNPNHASGQKTCRPNVTAPMGGRSAYPPH